MSGAGVVREFESMCGPWYPGDRAEDIVTDIRACDPTAEVTVEDARRYLTEIDRMPGSGEPMASVFDRLRQEPLP